VVDPDQAASDGAGRFGHRRDGCRGLQLPANRRQGHRHPGGQVRRALGENLPGLRHRVRVSRRRVGQERRSQVGRRSDRQEPRRPRGLRDGLRDLDRHQARPRADRQDREGQGRRHPLRRRHHGRRRLRRPDGQVGARRGVRRIAEGAHAAAGAGGGRRLREGLEGQRALEPAALLSGSDARAEEPGEGRDGVHAGRFAGGRPARISAHAQGRDARRRVPPPRAPRQGNPRRHGRPRPRAVLVLAGQLGHRYPRAERHRRIVGGQADAHPLRHHHPVRRRAPARPPRVVRHPAPARLHRCLVGRGRRVRRLHPPRSGRGLGARAETRRRHHPGLHQRPRPHGAERGLHRRRRPGAVRLRTRRLVRGHRGQLERAGFREPVPPGPRHPALPPPGPDRREDHRNLRDLPRQGIPAGPGARATPRSLPGRPAARHATSRRQGSRWRHPQLAERRRRAQGGGRGRAGWRGGQRDRSPHLRHPPRRPERGPDHRAPHDHRLSQRRGLRRIPPLAGSGARPRADVGRLGRR